MVHQLLIHVVLALDLLTLTHLLMMNICFRNSSEGRTCGQDEIRLLEATKSKLFLYLILLEESRSARSKIGRNRGRSGSPTLRKRFDSRELRQTMPIIR